MCYPLAPTEGGEPASAEKPMPPNHYRYVGPDDIRESVKGAPGGTRLCRPEDLAGWLPQQAKGPEAVIATYIVDLEGVMRVASRNSEHVACAEGRPVLAAGEIAFAQLAGQAQPEVVEVSNQSTGYCPEPSCWSAVAAALDAAQIDRPDGFTAQFIFRRCPACGQRNIVKDGWYYCGVCDGELPEGWNF
jgi:hypothetical protein